MNKSQQRRSLTEEGGQNVPSRKDDDILCGVGSCKPSFLQVFARIGAFVGIYSVSGFFTSTLTIYVNSQVPMLEKQFGFSSAETGLLMSCNDIGYLSCVLFAGYIARKVHIPRGLGVSTILYGICGILCAMPYFLQEKSSYAIDSTVPTNVTQRLSHRKSVPMCLAENNSDIGADNSCNMNENAGDSAETSYNLEKLWIKKAAFALLAVGFVFQGIGKSPRYPFVTLYIDDAVNKRKTGFYMGILTATGIFGPAVAYVLGGVLSKIYVTLEAVDITPSDPRWVGAWWLGFLIFGACAIAFSFPLMCFPRKLGSRRHTQREEGHKPTEMKLSTDSVLKEIKYLALAIGRVLGNPVFTLVTLSSTLSMFGLAGTMAFSPKYISSQYTIPLWKANIILALSGITAASLGSFVGGVLTRKIKMTPQTTMKMLIILFCGNIIVSFIGLFIGCDQPILAGDGGQQGTSPHYRALEEPCRGDCTCAEGKYFPICGEDGRSYYSPCHAGCSTKHKMAFSNCTCITSGKAVSGLCDQGCTTKLYIYAAFNFLGGLSFAIKIMPYLIVKLRCVAEKDRAVATALSGFLNSALAWMPGPVVFGSIIDNTCLLWKYTCGERLSCQLYDIVYFRIAYHVFGIACKGIGLIMIVGLYIYFRITNKQQWREEQPPARELQLNGEELVKIKKFTSLPDGKEQQ